MRFSTRKTYKCPKCFAISLIQKRCDKCDRWMLSYVPTKGELEHGQKLNEEYLRNNQQKDGDGM